jgi:hypothetical protein
MGASASNKAARRNYEHRLKVRERKWMQTRTTYASKKVQFKQEVDQANIAAQRAYSRNRYQLNQARSLAFLENQEDFKKMLQNQGMIKVSAAERGVRGRSVAKALAQNQANFGMSQAMRSRALTMAGYKAKLSNEDVNRQLKGQLLKSFGKVAIQPVQDLAPPEPVYQNVGMTFMLGMGQALAAGLEGNVGNTGDGLKVSKTPTDSGTSSTSFYTPSTYLGSSDTSYIDYASSFNPYTKG